MTKSFQPHRESTFSSRWMAGSMIAHGVLLLAILYLLRPVDSTEPAVAKKPPNVTSAEHLDDLGQKVQQLQTRQLEESVASLEETLKTIEQMESGANAQLRDAFPEQTELATENLTSHREQALKAQRQALQSIADAMDKSRESVASSDFEQLRNAALESQSEAEDALAQEASARVLANQPTDALDDLLELQVTASQLLATARANDREASELQAQIEQQQKILENHRSSIERREAHEKLQQDELAAKLAELEAARQAIDDAKENVEDRKSDVARAEAARQAANDAFEKARNEANTARVSLDQIRRSADKSEVSEAEQALDASRQNEKSRLNDLRQADQQLNQGRHQVHVAEHGIRVAEHKLLTAQHRIDHVKLQIERTQADSARQQSNAEPHQQVIREQQARLAGLQKNSANQLAKALKAQQRALDENDSFDSRQPNKADDAASDSSGTLATFQRAHALEHQIAQKFKQIRAAELALMQKMDPSEARQLVSVALPQRAALDEAALDKNTRTEEALKHKLDTLSQANQQAKKMDEFAKSLLAQAQGLQQQGIKITLAQRQADTAAERSQSAEEDGGAVRDMTAIMAKRTRQNDPLGDSNISTEPKPNDEKYTIVDAPVMSTPTPPPGDMVSAVPARRFDSKGGTASKGWTFVDSWYILGPFDNHGRANIHKQFPPESLVDLDARYRTAASPTPIEWMFYQSSKPNIEPRHLQGEYVIYYATTEIHFEQPTDVWIAVGSDDRSDLWINDVRVWSSSDTLKAWRIDEGMRRVRFDAGMNKVLYRIENGNGPWAFSLCLNLDRQTPVAQR